MPHFRADMMNFVVQFSLSAPQKKTDMRRKRVAKIICKLIKITVLMEKI